MNSIIETILGLVTGGLGPWIAGGIAALGAIFAARRSGRNAEKIKQDAARKKDQDAARRVGQKTDAKGDDQIKKDAKKWIKS